MLTVESVETWMEVAWHVYSATDVKGQRLALEVSGLGMVRITVGGRPLYCGPNVARAVEAFNNYERAHAGGTG